MNKSRVEMSGEVRSATDWTTEDWISGDWYGVQCSAVN